MRSVTPNNRSLTYLQSGPFDQPQCYLPLARGAVSSVSLASSALLTYVEPLPLDQLVFRSTDTVRSWPAAARNEFLAASHRNLAVARRNRADLTLYLDNQSTHLAACIGRYHSTDVSGNLSTCARWDPVGPGRVAAAIVLGQTSAVTENGGGNSERELRFLSDRSES